jgi:hypothetical protein
MSDETGRVSGWRAAGTGERESLRPRAVNVEGSTSKEEAGTGERESLRPRGHDAPEVVA